MNKSSIIRARIEPNLKAEVERILSEIGLTTSDAIHMLCRQIKLRRGLPFTARIPNKLTAKTLTEGKKGKNVKHFTNAKSLYDDLGM